LQGDSTVTGLLRQMRSLVNTASGASSAFPRLSDLGLEIQRDGTLSVDSAKLDSADHRPDRTAQGPGQQRHAGHQQQRPGAPLRQPGQPGAGGGRQPDHTHRRPARTPEPQQRRPGQLSERVDKYKARLVAQYTAMDANLSKLNALSSYMTAQLAALSKASTSSS
jgi:flagellar hook-associated protein 2